MSPADHEHTWVRGLEPRDLRCAACGARRSAIQTTLGEAATDARRLAGDAHYTGCRVRQELEQLELWLFNAPRQLLQELQAIRPGVYMIHNDAPRPYRGVLDLMHALPVDRLRADGIRIVVYGPTQDGHLRVRVMGDLPPAQARLDAIYGEGVAEAEYGEPAVAFSHADAQD